MGKARRQNTKNFKKSILIYCPGITEQGYINSLKADRYKGLHVDVKPKLGKADQFDNILSSLLEEYSDPSLARTCFFINDMDAIIAQDMRRTYEDAKIKALKASNNELTIIESMPCIEFWFVLHYNYTDKYYPNYKSLNPTIRKHIPSYEKSKDWAGKIYSIVKSDIVKASKNAAKTMQKKKNCEGDCSYTNMHVLIEMLDQIYEAHHPSR